MPLPPLRLLSPFLHQHLALFPEPTPRPLLDGQDEALLQAQCQRRLLHHCRMIALTVLTFTLLWWPTDRLVFSPPGQGTMAVWRLVVCLATLGYLLLPGAALRRWPLQLFVPAMYLCCAVMGYTAGQLGGVERPFPHLLYTMVFGSVLVPLPLPWRAVLTAGIVGATLLGLHLAAPLSLAAPGCRLLLSFWLCAYLLSVLFGHVLFVLAGQNFLQALEIRRQGAALADSNATLERRIADKTRDLRALLQHVERAREDERLRISRDLHDDLGQELSALRYALALLRRRHQQDPGRIARNLDELDLRLDKVTQATRHIVADLRPRVLDDLGLGAALAWLVRDSGQAEAPRVTLTQGDLPDDLPEAVRVGVFRIAQEALVNVRRHAAAGEARVALAMDPRAERLTLRVEDDGAGFTPPPAGATTTRGLGLLGMRERALALGATLRIDSRPGLGTTLELTLPLGGQP